MYLNFKSIVKWIRFIDKTFKFSSIYVLLPIKYKRNVGLLNPHSHLNENNFMIIIVVLIISRIVTL